MAAVLALWAAGGCAKGPPVFTDVSGLVLLDGQPLPQARVEFIPDLGNYGAEMNSSAVTDDNGRFTLARTFSQQPGAAVGKHRVLVTEVPTPGEFRSQNPETQAKYAQFKAKLKNRPIPPGSGVLATALVVEVTAETKEYRIELKRTQ